MPGAGVGLPKAMPDRGPEFTFALSQTEPFSTQRPSTATRTPRAEIAREIQLPQHPHEQKVGEARRCAPNGVPLRHEVGESSEMAR